jgi:hypothetical protein
MSLSDETWGVSLMRLQANLPDSLPGQNATFLLFGDVQIENAVTAAPEITVTATGNANVRSLPTTAASNVISSLSIGQEVSATGRLDDSSWVKIRLPGDERQVAWVSAQFIDGDVEALTAIDPAAPRFGPMQAFRLRTGFNDRPCDEAPDSGVLVQTPKGAGQVRFNVNEVLVTLGSTAYLQAGGGFLTVTVLDGLAALEAFGSSQLVPAGSFARVPLNQDGLVAGPPEFPQPYDFSSLQSLPVGIASLPDAVVIAPALAEDEIEAVIDAIQNPPSSDWTLVYTRASTTCAMPGPNATYNSRLTFEADGTLLIMNTASPTSPYNPVVWTPVSEATYTTNWSRAIENGGLNTVTGTITFSSPTTLTGESTLVTSGWASASRNCQTVYSISGQRN